MQAQSDVTTAFNDLAGRASNFNLTGQDLGGLTLIPGVYTFASSAQLTGTLTLNAQGNPNAEFIFQIGSAITTASNASVAMINGADGCNVYWQVGSSATLGTDTAFAGNILADQSITVNTRASIVSGRALARIACSDPGYQRGLQQQLPVGQHRLGEAGHRFQPGAAGRSDVRRSAPNPLTGGWVV